MALFLYKSAYRNIKRTTKRHLPSSRYYLVFDWTHPITGKKQKHREPLGQLSPEVARDMGIRLMAEIKEAATRAPEHPEAQRRLSDAMAALVAAKASHLKPSTIKRYDLCDRNLLAGLGDLPLAEFKLTQVQDWVLLRQQTVDNQTINRDLARLRQIVNWALDEEWIVRNPLRKMKLLREPARERFLSEDECQRLWAVSSPWLWRVVWFAIQTGCRWSEQFRLRWSAIEGDQIRLSDADTKSSRARTIPINAEIREILESARGEHEDFVFVTEVKRRLVNPSNFARDYWLPALKAAGIENFRWHDLRHTAFSWIIQEGGRLEAVRVLAGHEDIRTTQRYAHLAPGHLVHESSILAGQRRHLKTTPIGHAPSKIRA